MSQRKIRNGRQSKVTHRYDRGKFVGENAQDRTDQEFSGKTSVYIRVPSHRAGKGTGEKGSKHRDV